MKDGDIYYSKLRTKDYQLYVMIVLSHLHSETQFNAIVISDDGGEHTPGEYHDNWNKNNFEKSDKKIIIK